MLMAVDEWVEKRFTGEKKPHPNTVRRWLNNGDLPGKQFRGRWYVDVAAESGETGCELADKVLNG